MVADIKLEDGVVTVEDTDPTKPVTQLKVKAWDIVLDAPDRRKNQTGDRRALVHGPGDNLTINWGNDYPGGVNILGTVELGAIHARDGKLSIRNPKSLNSTTMTGDTIICSETAGIEGGHFKQKDYDLLKEIKQLRAEVDALKAKYPI